MADQTEPVVPTIPELIDMLSQWMQVEQSVAIQVDAIRIRFDEEAGPLVKRLDDAKMEIGALRSTIKSRMEEIGATTVANDVIQVQRPSSTKWAVVNEELALAHLADLERLHEVRRVVTDQVAVINIAKQLGKLEGVEQVTERGFKVVPVKQKKSS